MQVMRVGMNLVRANLVGMNLLRVDSDKLSQLLLGVVQRQFVHELHVVFLLICLIKTGSERVVDIFRRSLFGSRHPPCILILLLLYHILMMSLHNFPSRRMQLNRVVHLERLCAGWSGY